MYTNVAEIESALDNLAAAYPATSELILPPWTTHDGNATGILRLGRHAADARDGLLLGGVHAREWIPPDAMVSLAADLLAAEAGGTGLTYGGVHYDAGEIATLFETLNLFIFACVNPDGRAYSQAVDGNWRKNRRPTPPGGGASCHGVDLNRNFDFLWDHETRFAADAGVATSSDPCNYSVYRGPSAASEPETRNVVWVLDGYPRIRWHIDLHSAVPVILHSWGSDENQITAADQSFLNPSFDGVRGRPGDTAYGEHIPPDDLTVVTGLSGIMDAAIAGVRGTVYGHQQAYGLYPTSGASDDYAFSRAFARPDLTKVYGFTIECGSSFQPPWTEAEAVIREVSAGLIAFARNCKRVTDGAGVALRTPTLVFNDVPEGETTVRAISWTVPMDSTLTFEIVSGPSGPFAPLRRR
jgi:murein tripeptide amidase MpaA